MVTVRELIQALLLNCDLDDHIKVEFPVPCKGDPDSSQFVTEPVRHVFHLGEGEAIIECHDE